MHSCHALAARGRDKVFPHRSVAIPLPRLRDLLLGAIKDSFFAWPLAAKAGQMETFQSWKSAAAMQSDNLCNMGQFSQAGMLLPRHPPVHCLSCLSEVRQEDTNSCYQSAISTGLEVKIAHRKARNCLLLRPEDIPMLSRQGTCLTSIWEAQTIMVAWGHKNSTRKFSFFTAGLSHLGCVTIREGHAAAALLLCFSTLKM